MQNIRAEVAMPTRDLQGDIGFFTNTLGFRMEQIFPADDPRVVVLQGYGLRLRLDQEMDGVPAGLRILGDDPMLIADGQTQMISPGGVTVDIAPLNPPVETPVVASEFVVRRLADQAPWVVGRAGMQYRDLIPSRLGGAIIASHIRIPDGGPVPDMVHYHSVGFQLIFCYKGWVDLVYEDQGEPFRLQAGNCVIQPPEIRHRVLYASDNIEVIEIGVPAEHITTIDHQMELPTPHLRPDREWTGQRFVHHRAGQTPWVPHMPGFDSRDTTICDHTKGGADVHVIKRGQGVPGWHSHDADIHFTFVMAGTLTLEGQGQTPQDLGAGDAFVIPRGMAVRYANPSDDIELLEIRLPHMFSSNV
ncbi:MAG: cupin domain-containing protein [Pseudomonadota bacterium]